MESRKVRLPSVSVRASNARRPFLFYTDSLPLDCEYFTVSHGQVADWRWGNPDKYAAIYPVQDWVIGRYDYLLVRIPGPLYRYIYPGNRGMGNPRDQLGIYRERSRAHTP